MLSKGGEKGLVSVIIPTYNRARMITRTIDSVLHQTYSQLEVIVVDDCSPDNTGEVVKSYEDPRVRYIRQETNQGAPAARNRGLALAKGEFIALLDDDDDWLPPKLEIQVAQFRSNPPEVGLLYCGCNVVLREGKTVVERREPRYRGAVFREMLSYNFVPSVTPLLRREVFRRCGGYDESFPSNQDWEMWVRVAREFEFEFVPDVLANYYIHESQISTSLEKRVRGLEKILQKFRLEYKAHPDIYARHLTTLGNLLVLMDRYHEARGAYKTALRHNPQNKAIYFQWLGTRVFPSLYKKLVKYLSRKRQESKYGATYY